MERSTSARRAPDVVLTLALVMAAAAVAQAFGRFTWGVVLPEARDDLLDGSNTLAGLLGTVNVTAYLLGTLLMAWLASHLTLVWSVRLGLTISTTGLALAAWAPSGPVLAASLFVLGLGGAIIWVPSPGIATRMLPPRRRGLAVGMVGAGIGLGIVLAGQVASQLRRSGNDDVWQTVYRIELAIAVVVLAATFVWLRSQGDRPAVAGGFGGFRALRTVDGWVPLTVGYTTYGFSYLLVLGFLVARLEDDSGFTSAEASTMFAIVGGAAVLGGVALGSISDRVGRRATLTVAFLLFAGCTVLVLTGRQPWVAVASFGIGLLFAGVPSLIIAHVVAHTDDRTYGPAFSAATLAFGVAQMVSPQAGGAIADWQGSFTPVFLLSAAVALVGAAAASRLPD